MTAKDAAEGGEEGRTWIGKLTLTDFRNYKSATLTPSPDPIVLFGPNGAGKTNCLEAISLLTAGRGLRSLPFSELVRRDGAGGWAVAARLFLGDEEIEIGTGVQPPPGGALGARSARIVKIDGSVSKGSGALARVRIVWLTPAMDGLFTGPASERRRFLDRLALSFDPAYANAAAAFDRAMRQRNKALEDLSPPRLLDGIEAQMARAAAEIAAFRHWSIEGLAAEIRGERDRTAHSVFPWARLSLEGDLEAKAASESVHEICSYYARHLSASRERDRAAGRTLAGPHRSDLEVMHGPKGMPAKLCSTGEQKSLLLGLALAQARLVKRLSAVAPLILLDEIAAHLDAARRVALFSSIASLNAQVWMTGTGDAIFAPLRDVTKVQFFHVSDGAFSCVNGAESASNPYI